MFFFGPLSRVECVVLDLRTKELGIVLSWLQIVGSSLLHSASSSVLLLSLLSSLSLLVSLPSFNSMEGLQPLQVHGDSCVALY